MYIHTFTRNFFFFLIELQRCRRRHVQERWRASPPTAEATEWRSEGIIWQVIDSCYSTCYLHRFLFVDHQEYQSITLSIIQGRSVESILNLHLNSSSPSQLQFEFLYLPIKTESKKLSVDDFIIIASIN